MKTNEAPEKLHIDANDNPNDTWFYAFITPSSKGKDIEYTRTDVFIKKTIEFMKNVNLYLYNCISEECNYVDTDKMIEDFKNYMEGE